MYEVHYLLIAPSSSSDWGEGLLVDTVFVNGDEFIISLDGEICVHDIRLEDADSDTGTRLEVNLCMYPHQSFPSDDLDSED